MACRMALVSVTVAALVAAGCSDGDGSAAARAGGGGSGEPLVVATTSIWADVVANVACDGQAEVVTIIPIGGDSHAFEASLADRDAMGDAALVVANGLRLEEGLEDTLEAVEAAGTPVLRIGDHLDPIGSSSGTAVHDHVADDDDDVTEDDHDVAEDDHDHSDVDPHIWFDPAQVSAALPLLADSLVSEGGLDAAAVEECVTAYQAELAALDAEVSRILAVVPEGRRKLVTNHGTLGHFAAHYGFEVIGTVIPSSSTLAETNPAALEELARLIDETGVRAIFAETQHSTDEASALADRVGDVEVVALYTETLGEQGSGAETYVGFLRSNAQLVADALS